MSRHRLPTIRRRPIALRRRGPGSSRTRLVLAAAAVIALLSTAWVIGRPASGDHVAPAGTPSAGTETTGLTEVAAGPAPATTIPSADLAGGSSGADLDRSVSAVEEFAPSEVATSSGSRDGTATTAGSVEPKVVRTGTLEVVVAEGRFGSAVARLTTLATGAGGFVSASETSSVDGSPWGTITLRIPADRFDDAFAEVRKLGEVATSSTSAQDVTGEYTDLGARLKALTAERDQITAILGRAESIPDILSVRDRLTAVQAEIEQLQGRQQVLDDQSALSTITVALREQGEPAPVTTAPRHRTGFDRLWHDAGDRFTDGGRSIALGLASMAPWLLLGLVLLVPARMLWRRAASADDARRGLPGSGSTSASDQAPPTGGPATEDPTTAPVAG